MYIIHCCLVDVLCCVLHAFFAVFIKSVHVYPGSIYTCFPIHTNLSASESMIKMLSREMYVQNFVYYKCIHTRLRDI